MTSASGGGNVGDDAPEKKDSPASEADADGSEAQESGYRRDDYWREESRDEIEPDTKPESGDGFAFESPEEKAKAGGDGADAPRPKEAREQGNAGGRDDANIVEKG